MNGETPTQSRISARVLLAFVAVYVVWGSTYLAIQYVVDTSPPLASSSLRFLIAGLLMLAIARLRSETELSPAEKKVARLSGILLISANAVVCLAEKRVSSGVAAVVIGGMPIWIMLLGWLFFQQGRPGVKKLFGALLGLFGIAAVTAHGITTGVTDEYLLGILLLLSSSVLWSTGTLIQRHTKSVRSTFLFTASQMLTGSAAAGLLSLCGEDLRHFAWGGVSTRSVVAFIYLIFFGSVIGFTSYSWLSRRVAPHLVSTYALVNPVIAVALGWAFAGESLTAAFIFGVMLILAGLALLIF